jgi:hypothetical protein
MFKSLYDIQTEHAALITELIEAEGDLSPELEMALSINKDELQAKAESYALRILEINGQSDFIANEIKRLQYHQKQYDRASDKLKETIKAAMVQFNTEKIETNRVKLSLRKSEVCEVPESFSEEVLKFVNIKAEIDQSKVDAITYEAESNKVDVPFIPTEEMLQYFKLSASVDKAKIKIALKAGTSVGNSMLLTKQNLQIK